MRTVLRAVAALIVLAAVAVAAHFVVIEWGREVAVLRTQRSDGSWQETRLWIVDDAGSAWLHSAGPDWAARVAGDPIVEVVREGAPRRYQAHAVPGPHPRIHELLRAKYGWADRWVRFIGPDTDQVLVVRLDPL